MIHDTSERLTIEYRWKCPECEYDEELHGMPTMKSQGRGKRKKPICPNCGNKVLSAYRIGV